MGLRKRKSQQSVKKYSMNHWILACALNNMKLNPWINASPYILVCWSSPFSLHERIVSLLFPVIYLSFLRLVVLGTKFTEWEHVCQVYDNGGRKEREGEGGRGERERGTFLSCWDRLCLCLIPILQLWYTPFIFTRALISHWQLILSVKLSLYQDKWRYFMKVISERCKILLSLRPSIEHPTKKKTCH